MIPPCSPHFPSYPLQSRLPPEVNRILYVRNLPFRITAEELYDIFGKYGAVYQIRLGDGVCRCVALGYFFNVGCFVGVCFYQIYSFILSSVTHIYMCLSSILLLNTVYYYCFHLNTTTTFWNHNFQYTRIFMMLNELLITCPDLMLEDGIWS